MAHTTSTKELQKMNKSDLRKEIAQQEADVVKLRLGVKLGKEKNSAKYIAQKKQLARMKTVYNQKSAEGTEVTEGAEEKKSEKTPRTKPKKTVSSRSKKS